MEFAASELNAAGLSASDPQVEGHAQVYEVADATDSNTEDLLAKKKKIMDLRMRQRENKRAHLDAARQKERADKADPNQTTEKFWEGFKRSQKQTQAILDAANQAVEANANLSNSLKAKLADSLAPLTQALDDLQKLAAGAAYYLPPYDSRSAAVSIRALRSSLTATKEKVAPKKKFSFKEKRAAARLAKEKTRLAKLANKSEEKTDAAATSSSSSRSDSDAAVTAALLAAVGPVVVDYIVSNKKNETITVNPGALEKWAAEEMIQGGGEAATADGTSSSKSRDVVLANLEDCVVFLGDTMSALRVTNVKRCHVYGGPVAGSLLLEGCEDCIFWLASRQIRLHHAERCTFHLRVMSNPIIEDCTALTFSPYNLMYEGLPGMLVAAGLGTTFNDMWSRVQDFKWHRAQHSPNWIEGEDASKWLTTPKHEKVTLLTKQLVLETDQ